MIVRLASPDEFYATFHPQCVFGSRAFIEGNADRAQAVRFFIGYDERERPRLGAAMGYRDGEWLCPFSAPFGEVTTAKDDESLERVYDFVSELCDTLAGAPVRFTLPPPFYGGEMLTRLCGVLANYAKSTYYDYNYHYVLDRADRFEDHLSRSARKNYRHALQQGFAFSQTDDIARAYTVIEANRRSHGYPLAMSLGQVAETVGKMVTARFFLLTHADDDVAAAMVYDVAPGIGQVVYWGDAPGYSDLRPMNMLPPLLFAHYRAAGYSILDIGPSSKRGVPSPGLCRFKESLGCSLTLKPTFIL